MDGDVVFHSGALDEEKKRSSQLSQALQVEKSSAEQYLQELETEQLRSIQHKDHSDHAIQVRQKHC